MTTAITTEHAGGPHAPERARERLRAVLAVNAAASVVTGAAGAVAAPWWGTELGIDSVASVRVVSVALVAFAVGVALVAARAGHWLRTAALVISAVDLAWVVGSAAVLVNVDLTAFGRVVTVVLAVGVLDFAALQLWFRVRAR